MRKVLIVESDQETGNDIARLVQMAGYQPVVFQPEQILSVLFIDLNPEIVIIYRKMFVKNRQLFIEGNLRLSNAKIIITSAAYLSKDRVRELGADYFLQKPVSKDELGAALESRNSIA